jgi:DNA-directed RNA polymerase subunit H (RpoH/RPB5)
MEVILHALGLCPDSLSHIDFTDIIVCYYNEIQSVINIIRLRIGS